MRSLAACAADVVGLQASQDVDRLWAASAVVLALASPTAAPAAPSLFDRVAEPLWRLFGPSAADALLHWLVCRRVPLEGVAAPAMHYVTVLWAALDATVAAECRRNALEELIMRTYGKNTSRDLSMLPPPLQAWYDEVAIEGRAFEERLRVAAKSSRCDDDAVTVDAAPCPGAGGGGGGSTVSDEGVEVDASAAGFAPAHNDGGDDSDRR